VKEIPPVSAEKPYQYQYAQHMASDLFMLSEIMKAIAHKYDEDVVQQAFKKCWEGEGTDFPSHYLWQAAEQLATDEYRHQHVVRAHRRFGRARFLAGMAAGWRGHAP
jgi:DNA-directed RNA polymerase specialized sigma24 family protein